MIPPTPMKKYVFLFLGCLSLSSCFYIAMYHFDSDDRVWLSPYEQGDTILFKSPEDIDTVIIKEIFVKDRYNPLMENEAHQVMEAYGYTLLEVFHHGQILTGSIGIRNKGFHRLRLFVAFADRIVECDESELSLKEETVGGKTYPDAFSGEGKPPKAPISKNRAVAKHFIWSKSQGLLQYTYKGGETYTLYKK